MEITVAGKTQFDASIDWRTRTVTLKRQDGAVALPTSMEIPIGVIKGLAATILTAEAHAEAQQPAPRDVGVRT
jgi:hypothetical protein